jgi:hypothetical protein
MADDDHRDDYELDTDGLCDCCGEPWDQCRHFFVNWICGLMPDGSCSLAGTEECDWECPRNG